MSASTGAHTRLSYYWEGSFAEDPGSTTDTDQKPFGRQQVMTTLEGSNEAVRQFEPGSREAARIIETVFDGSFSVEFQLSNPWWLAAVITSASTTDNGDGTYTHTFDGEWPDTMQIRYGNEVTNEERILKGCVATSCTIDATVPDDVTVTLDGAYADEETTTSLTARPSYDHRGYTFTEAVVNRSDDGDLAYLQNATINIENTIDIVNELGQRSGVDFSPKERNVDIDYSEIVNDTNVSNTARLYGDSAASSVQSEVTSESDITVTFSDSNEEIVFNIASAMPNSMSVDNIGDPTEDTVQEMTEWAASINADATNGTTTAR